MSQKIIETEGNLPMVERWGKTEFDVLVPVGDDKQVHVELLFLERDPESLVTILLGNEFVFTGYSKRHPKDAPDAFVGRKQAVRRALGIGELRCRGDKDKATRRFLWSIARTVLRQYHEKGKEALNELQAA